MKGIALLGSTGSIGTQSLDVCRMHGYRVVCLTANRRVDLMEAQIREFRPDLVSMMDPAAADDLRTRVADTGTKVLSGMDGLIECATYSGADTVLNAVVGMVGLQPTLAAIQAKKTLALANKETLVAGGHLVMNKGLEFIEAKWLFDMPIDAIDIVVHRESVVHSAIAYQDNSVIAQLGVPDMRIPIQYALTYPRRLPSPVQELSLVDYGKLTFYAPDYDTFRCINVCKDAIAAGGLRPAAANGANEESVRLFLNGKIKFTDIAVLNRAAMEACPQVADYTLNDVLQADRAARDYVIEAVS